MSTTEDRPYAGAFREWWLRRSFYAKNFLILDAIALFVLVIALVATAAGSSDSTSTTHSGSSSSSSYSGGNSQSAYLAEVRSEVSGGDVNNTAHLLQYGYGACRSAELGVGNEWATTQVRLRNMDYSAATAVYSAALDHLC